MAPVDVTCPACGTPVAPVASPQGLRCPKCNLLLARTGTEAVLGRLAIKRVSAEEMAEPPVLLGGTLIEEPAPRFQRVLIADDLALHRQLLEDGLRARGIAENVVATSRGDQFVTAAVDHFIRKQAPDLFILDLEMPGLSGFHAAVAARAAERAFGLAATPILFFSAHPCDDRFKKAMSELGGSTYLNKGAGKPQELFDRVEQVLRTFKGRAALV